MSDVSKTILRNDPFFLKTINEIVKLLERNKFKGIVYLFGSSVRGDFRITSDIDIAIDNVSDKDFITISEAIYDILTPYKIDIVNLSKVSSDFKDKVLSEGVVIWKSWKES